MSLQISYDSTFNGFLTAVFEIYRQHLDVAGFSPDRDEAAVTDLFMERFRIETDEESANRLRRAITNASSAEVLNLLETAFLSEESGIEMKVFAFLKKLFAGVDPNYGRNPASMEMLPIYKIAQSVRREAGGMLGIVRFDKAEDDVYVAQIEPKYDILMLMESHFTRRFASQKWILYDLKRNYGLLHDKNKSAQVVELANPEILSQKAQKDEFTKLWKNYYDSISIKERENPQLLKRCLPVRYWKHLPERCGQPALQW